MIPPEWRAMLRAGPLRPPHRHQLQLLFNEARCPGVPQLTCAAWQGVGGRGCCCRRLHPGAPVPVVHNVLRDFLQTQPAASACRWCRLRPRERRSWRSACKDPAPARSALWSPAGPHTCRTWRCWSRSDSSLSTISLRPSWTMSVGHLWYCCVAQPRQAWSR